MIRLSRFVAMAALCLTAAVPPAFADHTLATPEAATAATAEFETTNHMMHAGMNVPSSGDVDRDFALGMIAHHQGAVEMAQTHLKYGTDPEMRALAEAIIAAQTPEIAWMTAWLDSHPQ